MRIFTLYGSLRAFALKVPGFAALPAHLSFAFALFPFSICIQFAAFVV